MEIMKIHMSVYLSDVDSALDIYVSVILETIDS